MPVRQSPGQTQDGAARGVRKAEAPTGATIRVGMLYRLEIPATPYANRKGPSGKGGAAPEIPRNQTVSLSSSEVKF